MASSRPDEAGEDLKTELADALELVSVLTAEYEAVTNQCETAQKEKEKEGGSGRSKHTISRFY